MNLAVIPLALIPVTWAYAILRYRLMDVDIIFQEGYVYTLATLAVLGIFSSLVFSLNNAGELPIMAMILIARVRVPTHSRLDSGATGPSLLLQGSLRLPPHSDRVSRASWARPTDLDSMLESVTDRLTRTLGVRHVAVFVWDEAESAFQLAIAANRRGPQSENVPYGLDLSFLSRNPAKPYLFFERHPRHAGRGLARMAPPVCAAPSRSWS